MKIEREWANGSKYRIFIGKTKDFKRLFKRIFIVSNFMNDSIVFPIKYDFCLESIDCLFFYKLLNFNTLVWAQHWMYVQMSKFFFTYPMPLKTIRSEPKSHWLNIYVHTSPQASLDNQQQWMVKLKKSAWASNEEYKSY